MGRRRNRPPARGSAIRAPSIEALPPNVDDANVLSWESQACQYPETGPAGISYFEGRLNADYHVDCLLYRDQTGALVGILNHYPADLLPYQRKGQVNIWVHPGRQRHGIATALALEALSRWQVKAHGQDLTISGAAAANAMRTAIVEALANLRFFR